MRILLTFIALTVASPSAAATMIRLGVVDTGLSKEQRKNLPICGTYSALNDPEVIDTHGHGTNILGLIVEQVDQTSKIPYCFVVTKYKSGDMYSYINALKYAVDYTPRLNGIVIAAAGFVSSSPETLLIKHALNNDTAVIVASGNYGANLDEKNVYPAVIDPRLIVVGCSTCYGRGNYGKIVDIYVDGQNKGTPMMTGTSQAAAIVAGRFIRFLQTKVYTHEK